MAAAFLSPHGREWHFCFPPSFAPLVISVLFTRFDSYTWVVIGYGSAAFGLTLCQFRYKAFILGFAEALFLAIRAYKLLMFVRASEDIASSSILSAKLLFLAIIGLFAVHLYIAYLISFRKHGSKDCLREHIALSTILAILIFVVGILLPPDFVQHSIVLNNLRKEPDPKPVDLGGKTVCRTKPQAEIEATKQRERRGGRKYRRDFS